MFIGLSLLVLLGGGFVLLAISYGDQVGPGAWGALFDVAAFFFLVGWIGVAAGTIEGVLERAVARLDSADAKLTPPPPG